MAWQSRYTVPGDKVCMAEPLEPVVDRDGKRVALRCERSAYHGERGGHRCTLGEALVKWPGKGTLFGQSVVVKKE